MIKVEEIPAAVIHELTKPLTYPAGTRVQTIEAMRFIAALKAWPGMDHISGWQTIGGWRNARIILPITQEPTDE